MSPPVRVGLELGSKRTFCWAVEWPGWCRSARGEVAALAALAAYAPRYSPVAAAAGDAFPAGPAGGFEVVERLPGSTSTDFGAPGAIGDSDSFPLSPEAGARLGALLVAAWQLFDQVARLAPAELGKGPRGGGPDRDGIVEHVLACDLIYARKLGLKPPAAPSSPPGVAALRAAAVRTLGARDSATTGAKGWPPRYYARRAAWHVLDHAWEIQDRSQPG